MLNIGKSYIVRMNGTSRLCADLTIDNRRATLWFGVDNAHEEWLALGRADAFVMALLPSAMRGGHEIVCEDPMSERLHYQLINGLIPTLAFAGELYHPIKITASLTAEKTPSQGAVGTGFSGGVDCLYTIMCHEAFIEYRLTHLVVFNIGSPRRSRSTLQKIFRRAQSFGAEHDLQAAFVDTNFKDILPEYIVGVSSFRNLACALALQRLFAIYLLSSGPKASRLDLNLSVRRSARYDLLTVNCVSTESLAFYLSGAETTRSGKLTALTQWEPSRRWLNPCFIAEGESCNCGRCKKCIRDLTVLYALGQLDQYSAVFDIEDYLQHLPERIGYVLANDNGHNVGHQVVQLLKEREVSIPQTAYMYEKIFRLARQRNAEIMQDEEELT